MKNKENTQIENNMTELFYLDENKKVIPFPETLIYEPFKKIWERNENKEISLKELAYVWSAVSPSQRNPFRGLPEDMRSEIAISLGLSENWMPDDDIKNAEQFLRKAYTEMWTVYKTWDDTNKIVNRLRRYLNTIDLDERTDKGYLVHKPGDIAIAVERLAKNAKVLKELEESLFKEIGETKSKDYSPAADPEFFKNLTDK